MKDFYLLFFIRSLLESFFFFFFFFHFAFAVGIQEVKAKKKRVKNEEKKGKICGFWAQKNDSDPIVQCMSKIIFSDEKYMYFLRIRAVCKSVYKKWDSFVVRAFDAVYVETKGPFHNRRKISWLIHRRRRLVYLEKKKGGRGFHNVYMRVYISRWDRGKWQYFVK